MANFRGDALGPNVSDWNWGWVRLTLGLIAAILIGIVLCRYVHFPAWSGASIFPLPVWFWTLVLILLLAAALLMSGLTRVILGVLAVILLLALLLPGGDGAWTWLFGSSTRAWLNSVQAQLNRNDEQDK